MVKTIFDDFAGYKYYRYMLLSHLDNGDWDMDAFKATEYAKKYEERLELCYRFSAEPMSEECLEWYKERGLIKEMFENEDFYKRWILVRPIEVKNGKKYPVIFFNHNAVKSIEFDEYAPGFADIAAKEGFFYVYLQNTNWMNLDRVLDIILEKYPIDSERVYVCGYSQGGSQTTSYCFQRPYRVAAAAPCGNDIFRLGDVFGYVYNEDDIAKLREAFIPVMMMVGELEYGNNVPMNVWRDRYFYPYRIPYADNFDPREGKTLDPTDPPDVKRHIPAPPKDFTQEQKDRWKIDLMNLRFDTLNIEERDPYRCLYYRQHHDSELHKALGFYADKEETRVYGGLKHWVADIYNRDGVDAFRFVDIENTPHHTPVTMGEMVWDFFKQFRRDSTSGKVVMDEYFN